MARPGAARVHQAQQENLCTHAGSERNGRERQTRELGQDGRPAPHRSAHSSYRRALRHDGSGGHGKNREECEEGSLSLLPQWKPLCDIRRPADLYVRSHQVHFRRGFGPFPMTYLTADLFDQHGDALNVCEAPLRNYGGRARFHGAIRTVRCREDNALLKRILSEPGAGKVLVVDGGASLHRALMGDNVATLALTNGWSGVVIFGAIRDSAAIGALQLGVKALGTIPRRPE